MTREQINNLLDKIDDFRYDLKNTAGVKEEVFGVASVIVVIVIIILCGGIG